MNDSSSQSNFSEKEYYDALYYCPYLKHAHMLHSVLYQQMSHHATHEIRTSYSRNTGKRLKYWLLWQGRDKGPYIYTHPPVLHDALHIGSSRKIMCMSDLMFISIKFCSKTIE
jgi:hypothetical protein